MSSAQPWTRTAAWVCAIGAGGFVALAATLIPWHPVPGGALHPVSASSVFSAGEIARAEQVALWSRVWSWSGLAISLSTAGLLGFTSLGRRLITRVSGPWWIRSAAAVALCLLVGRLFTLAPAAALQQLRLRWGLSTQPWASWGRDLVVSELISFGVTLLGVWGLLCCARRFPRRWPAVAAMVGAVLVPLGSFGYPLVVEPMFNSFTPMPAGPQRQQLQDLAAREGVQVDEVLVADASRRTTALNAYVSGVGSSRRLVLYDTLLADLSPEQTLTVVAHELSHARHRDVEVGTGLGVFGLATGIGLLGLVLGWRRTPIGPAAVPLILALVAVGSFAASPISSGISRQVETRADVDSLRWTQADETFVEMQRELALASYADPTPPAWSAWWFSTHPGVLTRIAIADRLADAGGGGRVPAGRHVAHRDW